MGKGIYAMPKKEGLNYVFGSLYVPSAKHLLTLEDLLSLNKEEARPVRRGTFVCAHAWRQGLCTWK